MIRFAAIPHGPLVLALATLAGSPGPTHAQTEESSTMKKLTPVVSVEAIEPCVSFWTETLGFEKTMEVPADDGRLGFAAFQKGSAEVMYQTLDSMRDDIPELVDQLGGASVLYVEVDGSEVLDALEEALDPEAHVIPRRTTFYGADEIVVRDPCGTVVILAAFEAGG